MSAPLRLVPDGLVPEDPEHLEEWELFGRAAGWSEATFVIRLKALSQLRRFAGVPLPEVTANHLAKWIVSFPTPPYSSATRATYYRCVRSYFTWLRKAGYRVDDPTEVVRRPKDRPRAPRPVATSAIEQALRACRRRQTYAYIVLGAFTGLRVHEIAKIRGEDVDLERGTLYVVGKGGVDAVVPLHSAVARLARGFPDRGYWFPSSRSPGKHVRAISVGDTIVNAFAKVGVDMTAHQLRHWYGTECLRASGGNLRVAQELLRHASPASTALYTRIEDKERRSAVDALSLVVGEGLGPVATGAPVPVPPRLGPSSAWTMNGSLTDGELGVLAMIAAGKSGSRIVEEAGISKSTLARWMKSLYQKIGASSHGELIFRAVQAGLLAPSRDKLSR